MINLGNIMRVMRNSFSTGRLTAYGSTVGEVQTSLQSGEVVSELEHPQEWGFSSKSPLGQKTYSFFQAGSRDNGACLIVAGECPVDLAVGESCVYNQAGITVHLKSDGVIEITGATALEVSGDVQDAGTITPTMQDMRDKFNIHTHSGGTVPAPDQQM